MTATRSQPQILPKRTCVCGHLEHDHNMDTHCHECGQPVDGDDRCTVRGCGCEGYLTACQNCGQERKFSEGGYAVCSRRCLYQIEYAKELAAA